ncbi:hypothetical protein SKAU_G00135510 [Synaphobranchus kaupii]|uniref:CCHC-type domain-containing protein n=1 Tax=Synaphobranchus kaupii TaxID=118154 RepID=A0A9Q1FR76_SYNKA|nr:hypothetical protein SKAU_G00135510 [Synaphobranchus kaupii]
MASEREESVPKAGLRNTLRFLWKRAEGAMISREAFGRQVLMGALKQKVADVLCFQSNSLERSFDITLCTNEACKEVLEECRQQGAQKPVSSFEVMSLDRPNFRLVTLHMFNPHVTDQAVAGFLGQYAEVLTEARWVRDTLGFWTGKRQYQVLFKPVPEGVEGFEGFLHPPARFSIGADRARGHTEEGCGAKKCRRCGVVGHEVKNCPVPKACYGCGERGHLAKACPNAKPAPDEGPAGQEVLFRDGKGKGAQVEKRPPLKVRRTTSGGRKASGKRVPDPEVVSALWTGPWAVDQGFDFAAGDGPRLFAFGKGVPKENQGMLTTGAMEALENLTGALRSTDVATGMSAKLKRTADKGEDSLKGVPHKPVIRAAVLKIGRKVVIPPVSEPEGRSVDPPAEEISAGPSKLTEGEPTETVGGVPKQWGDCVMEGVEGPDGGVTSPGVEEEAETAPEEKKAGEEKASPAPRLRVEVKGGLTLAQFESPPSWDAWQAGYQCYLCGVYGHVSRNCLKRRECLRCGEKGHYFRDCPRAKQAPGEMVAEREESPKEGGEEGKKVM